MQAHIKKIRPVIITLFLGIPLGAFILSYGALTTRWVISYSVVLILTFSGMITKRPNRFFLFVFYFTLPIVTANYPGKLSRVHFGGPPDFYFTCSDFPLLILYLILIPKLVLSKTHNIHFSKFDLPIIGLIALSVFSMYNALDPRLCLYAIFRLIIMCAIFKYMATFVTEIDEIKLIMAALLLSLLCETGFAFIQYCQNETFGMVLIGEAAQMMHFVTPRATLSRVAGTLQHPNDFAIYLGLLLPLSLSLFCTTIKRRCRIALGLIFIMAVIGLILTLSRGGWICFLICLVVVIVLGLRARLFTFHGLIPRLTVAIIILAGIIFPFQQTLSTRLFSDDYGAARSRIPLAEVAMTIISAHPLTGIGINNYADVMHEYDNTSGGITGSTPNPVHNSYLLIAAEIGIMGLMFFLWFVSLVYKTGIDVLATTSDKFIAWVTIGILGGLVSFLLHVIIEPMYLTKPIFAFFWALTGLVVALAGIKKRNKSERS